MSVTLVREKKKSKCPFDQCLVKSKQISTLSIHFLFFIDMLYIVTIRCFILFLYLIVDEVVKKRALLKCDSHISVRTTRVIFRHIKVKRRGENDI